MSRSLHGRTDNRIDPVIGFATHVADPVAWVAWTAGRDAGRRVGLSPGRHVVGRSASAAVRTEDPTVELHHAVLAVADDGTIRVAQLTGRQPVQFRDGVLDLAAGSLAIVEAGPPSDVAAAFQPVEIAAPQTDNTAGISAGGVSPALLGIAGSGIAAIAFGQVLVLVFGLIGGAIGISTWIVQRVGGERSRRAAGRRHRDDLQRFADELAAQQSAARAAQLASTSTLERAVADLASRRPHVWPLRGTAAKELKASIGEGLGAWSPRVVTGVAPAATVADLVDAASSLDRVPVIATFGAGSVLAVVADEEWCAAMARSIVLQLAAAAGPADWQLVVRQASDALWDELASVPHAVDSAGTLCTDPSEVDPGRLVVILVEDSVELASRTGELRQLMATHDCVAVIALCRNEQDIPAAATSIITIDRRGSGRWIVDTQSSGLGQPFRPAGASVRTVHESLVSSGHLAQLDLPATVGGVCPASSPWAPPSSAPSNVTTPERVSSSA